jgi:hypothetical protein
MGTSLCCVSHRSSTTFALSTHQQGPCSIPPRSRIILNKVTCMRRLPDCPQIPVQSSCATWNCPTNTLLESSLDALALLLCMLPHARPLQHSSHHLAGYSYKQGAAWYSSLVAQSTSYSLRDTQRDRGWSEEAGQSTISSTHQPART